MKKNRLIHISILLFIFLCLFIRFFCNYQTWPKIVLAITVSSIFFSLSDLFCVIKKGELSIIQDLKNYKKARKKQIDQLKYVDSISYSHKTESQETSAASANQSSAQPSSTNQEFNQVKNKPDEIDKMIIREKKWLSIFSLFHQAFIVIGFLVLFCILAFESLSILFAQRQDILTVIAFALILSSHYLEDLAAEIHENIKYGIETNFKFLHEQDIEH